MRVGRAVQRIASEQQAKFRARASRKPAGPTTNSEVAEHEHVHVTRARVRA
jgi:hypothetical protein